MGNSFALSHHYVIHKSPYCLPLGSVLVLPSLKLLWLWCHYWGNKVFPRQDGTQSSSNQIIVLPEEKWMGGGGGGGGAGGGMFV